MPVYVLQVPTLDFLFPVPPILFHKKYQSTTRASGKIMSFGALEPYFLGLDTRLPSFFVVEKEADIGTSANAKQNPYI
jgi:hypothetical protein